MRRAHSIRPQTRKAQAPNIIEDGWALRRISGLEIVKAELLDAVPWVVHGFSTRKSGASWLNGAAALNLGFTDWDSRDAVAQNRRALALAISNPKLGSKAQVNVHTEESLITLQQIHSDVVHVISKPSARPPQGDAALCNRTGLFLGVLSADCIPILLADVRRRMVGAVHAGWRGTLARVVAKTIGRMRLEFGTQPEDVLAALGPAIGPCCYEVGREVAQAFAAQFARAAEWFEGPFERFATGEEPNPLPWLNMMPPGHDPPPERVRLDLRAANRWQLVDAGVNPRNISVSALCTGCRSDLFFSYRKQGAGTGRMMSMIGISADSR
jgi:YfiH family protein